MVRREMLDRRRVRGAHGQRLDAPIEQQRQVLVRHLQLAERSLHRYLPDDGGAQQDAIARVGQMTTGVLAQALVAAQEPERGVRVEQQLHRAPNASARSSGSSSKSSA